MTPVQRQILDHLRESGERETSAQIARTLNIPEPEASTALRELGQMGCVDVAGSGYQANSTWIGYWRYALWWVRHLRG